MKRIFQGMPREMILSHKREIDVFNELSHLPEPWAMGSNVILPSWYRNNAPDETDVILIGPPGVYSLEIKCWFGEINGYFNDAYVDRIIRPGFPPEAWPNPMKTANDKKNILYSTLRDNLYRGKMRFPVIGGVIFSSRDECTVNLRRRFDVNMPILHHKELLSYFEEQTKALLKPNIQGYHPYKLSESEINDIFNFIRGGKENIQQSEITASSYVLTPLKYRSTKTYESYLAYNKFLPSQKALIKKLNIDPYLPDNDFNDRHERLLREARALEEMRGHPNIIEVLNVFLYSGDTYVVYEWIDGPSLADIIDSDNDYNPEDLLRNVMLPVMDAIRSAHEKKIMHRSLSSTCIILPSDGEVKIADFAMARGFEVSDLSLGTLRTKIEETPYSATESLTGKYGPSIDIYSLGAICFEIVTGFPPPTPTYRVRQGKELPFEKSRKGAISLKLQEIISEAMDLAPGRRFGDVGKMMEGLRNALVS